MAKQNQQNQQNQKQDNFDNKIRYWLILYGDIAVRGMIALILSLIVVFGVKLIFPEIPSWTFLVMLFLLSIIISPFLSRISVAPYFVDRYMQLLNNIVYKYNRGKYSNG